MQLRLYNQRKEGRWIGCLNAGRPIVQIRIMPSVDVVICNKLGLHARAASVFVKTSNKYKSKVSIHKDGLDVNGKSILGIMTLAAAEGSKITLEAEGEDASQALEELVFLINNRFGEDE